jgi:hypothetical protein
LKYQNIIMEPIYIYIWCNYSIFNLIFYLTCFIVGLGVSFLFLHHFLSNFFLRFFIFLISTSKKNMNHKREKKIVNFLLPYMPMG